MEGRAPTTGTPRARSWKHASMPLGRGERTDVGVKSGDEGRLLALELRGPRTPPTEETQATAPGGGGTASKHFPDRKGGSRIHRQSVEGMGGLECPVEELNLRPRNAEVGEYARLGTRPPRQPQLARVEKDGDGRDQTTGHVHSGGREGTVGNQKRRQGGQGSSQPKARGMLRDERRQDNTTWLVSRGGSTLRVDVPC